MKTLTLDILHAMHGTPVNMYIGLNDKDAMQDGKHIQIHSDEWFKETTAHEIGGCNFIECSGYYAGEMEKSLKVEIYGKKVREVIKIAKKLCVILNQNEIIVDGIFVKHPNIA